MGFGVVHPSAYKPSRKHVVWQRTEAQSHGLTTSPCAIRDALWGAGLQGYSLASTRKIPCMRDRNDLRLNAKNANFDMS
jgi:hypothetical protein